MIPNACEVLLPVHLTPLPLLAQQTQWRLLNAMPEWLVFLLVLGFVVAFGWLYLREATPAGKVARVFLAGLRGLAACALLALALAPACERIREEVTDSWALVLIDQSVSMSLEDRYSDDPQLAALAQATGLEPDAVAESARLALVQRALDAQGGAFLRQLAEKNRVKVYGFGQARRLTPLAELERRAPGAAAAGDPGAELEAALAAVRGMEPLDPETALGDSLALALGEARGRRVAGVVVLTDGRSNADVQPLLRVAESTRGVPIFTVGVGDPSEPRDIAVTDLQAPEVVIAGDRLRVRVAIQSQGFVGDERYAQLEVAMDDAVVLTEPIELAADGTRQEVTLQLRPETPGEYTLSVGIKPRPGELIHDNNQLSQRLRVIDKRIKVLLIDDLPRWEYRYLRWGLIRDETMEAHTFQISADSNFRQDTSPGLEPLTELPRTREEMFEYHVVILGDVNPNAPELDGRLELLRELVEEGGGGLLLVAGRRFMPGAYHDTPLASLLPVEVDRDDHGDLGLSQPITRTFSPTLTLDGRAHPVTQLENEPELNLATWQRLPGLYWVYRALSVKPTATVLAAHPEDVTAKDQPMPVIALQQSGAGTTMLVSTDDLWRWRAGVGDRYTQRFWGQAIRYLSTGRLLKSKRFSITTDKAVYDLGERVTIRAEVNDQSLQPSEEETQVVYLEAPDGEIKPVTLTRPPNRKGQYQGQVAVGRVGSYKVYIAAGALPSGAPMPGEELAMRIFGVQVPVLEKQDPKMDERTLRRIAEVSGGAYVPLAEIASVPAKVGSAEEVDEIVEDAVLVLMRWEVLCGLVALLGLEWLLRKRWKMW